MDTKDDKSGTITAGGVAQTISTRVTRHGLSLQNLSNDSLWLRIGGGAAAASFGSIEIEPGDLYESPPNHAPPGAVSLFGPQTGQNFTFWEW